MIRALLGGASSYLGMLTDFSQGHRQWKKRAQGVIRMRSYGLEGWLCG